MADATGTGYLEGRIEALREHIAALAAAAPMVNAASAPASRAKRRPIAFQRTSECAARVQ
jgi:hypothetical protein